MHALLARTLISQGAIRQDTILEAYHNARGLGTAADNLVLQRFVLIAARASNGRVSFEVRPEGRFNVLRIDAEAVLGVDGMDIRRFAGTYCLYEDGTAMPQQKRRGRRPRALIEAMRLAAEAEAAAQAAREAAEVIRTAKVLPQVVMVDDADEDGFNFVTLGEDDEDAMPGIDVGALAGAHLMGALGA